MNWNGTMRFMLAVLVLLLASCAPREPVSNDAATSTTGSSTTSVTETISTTAPPVDMSTSTPAATSSATTDTGTTNTATTNTATTNTATTNTTTTNTTTTRTSTSTSEVVPKQPSATFVDRTWRVTKSTSVAPGTLYRFGSDGKLTITSHGSKPLIGTWSRNGEGLVMVEESISYRVDILSLSANSFSIRSHNPGEPVDITMEPAGSP